MPTPSETERLVDKSVDELEIELGEMRIARQRLSANYQAFGFQLAEINTKLKRRLPHDQFASLQVQREDLIRRCWIVQEEITALNSSIAEISTVLEIRKRQSGILQRGEVKLLVELRDRWHAFSMDKENHQKARETAWEFVQELRTILKQHFEKQ